MPFKFYQATIIDENNQPIDQILSEGTIAQHFTACTLMAILAHKLRGKISNAQRTNAKEALVDFLDSLYKHKDLTQEIFLAFGNNNMIFQDLEIELKKDPENYDVLFMTLSKLTIPGVSRCHINQNQDMIYRCKISETGNASLPKDFGTAIEHFRFCMVFLFDSLNHGILLDSLYEKKFPGEKIGPTLKSKLIFFLSHLQEHEDFSSKNQNMSELESMLEGENINPHILNLFLDKLQRIQISGIDHIQIFINNDKIETVLSLKEIVIRAIINNRSTFFSVKQLLQIPDDIIDIFLKDFDPQRKLIIKVGRTVRSYINHHQITEKSLEYTYLMDLLGAITEPKSHLPNIRTDTNEDLANFEKSEKFNPYINVNNLLHRYLEKTNEDSTYKTSHVEKLNTELITLLKEYCNDRKQDAETPLPTELDIQEESHWGINCGLI